MSKLQIKGYLPHLLKKQFVKKNPHGSIAVIYSIQEHFHGNNLEIILRENKLTPEQRYQLTIKLLEALNVFHQGNYVHKDIKPGNILVSIRENDIKVKIIDLNLTQEENTKVGHGGTEGYKPPELTSRRAQLAKKQEDIYAMGIVLRRLWNDVAIEERRAKISGKKGKENEKGLASKLSAAEDFLQVSMKQFSSPLLSKLPTSQADNIRDIVNGMTKTNPEERVSLSAALPRLGIQVKNESKVTLTEKKEEPVLLDHETYYKNKNPLVLLNQKTRLFLLDEILENYQALLTKSL